MFFVCFCIFTGGKNDREMIPMNELGPGKCRKDYIHLQLITVWKSHYRA